MDEKFMEQASEMAEKANSSGVALCSKLAIPSKDLEPHQYKQEHCESCGEELEEFRKKKGQIICVPCKSIKERTERR
jgi:ribosomal protein L37AE/L43A